MRKLITLLTLCLFYLNVNSQKILIDERLEEPLKAILGRSIEHGVDLTPLLLDGRKNGYRTTLMEIRIVDSIALPAHVSSATFYIPINKGKDSYYQCVIEIEERTLRDFNNTENSLAHELGHVIGVPHDEEDINAVMFVVIDKIPNTLEYNLAYNSAYTKIRWEKYFNKLKTQYKLNHD